MTSKKNARNAFVTSVISLILCVSMLVGTTFAWFTDSVVSGNNLIQAGNLDIELEYSKDLENWTTVKDSDKLFDENALWEPGYTDVVYLRLSNLGNLALKYNLGIKIVDEQGSINVEGNEFVLSDYIKFGVVENQTTKFADRAAAIAAVDATATKLSVEYSKAGSMLGKTGTEPVREYVALVVYMPETVTNEANYKTGEKAPTIQLGIELNATQLMNEKDSFGSDYDEGADWLGETNTDWYNTTDTEFTLTTEAELAGLAKLVNEGIDSFEGKTVKLGADMDLNDILWTPIGNSENKFQGSFYGTGYTIYNLRAVGTAGVGLFGYTFSGAHIEGVTIDGAVVIGNDYVGAVLGTGYLAQNCLKNCTVKDAKITAIPYLMADGKTYDGGAKAGAVAGYAVNGDITGNKAVDCKVSAYRDLGGIVGMAQGENRTILVDGNAIEGRLDLSIVDLKGAAYEGGKVNGNMGNIAGRTANATMGSNTEEGEIEHNSVVIRVDEGVTYKKDVYEKTTTLYMVPADYAGDTLTVAEGTTNIGGYAFAYNDNIETIVLADSVTTLNDRAFRDTSASTVVLNEGLTNISYQAFRNALNVTSVEIPSTVTTISKEAFQNSGITELTVPANVTTIEYGAMRDMKNLEKVVIESNADIPVYAFRACTNLKTVILTGDNVTFGGGSRGMIFTNKENGDGSAITIYVANETVKERLLAADTAAKDYGGYEIIVATIPGADASEEEVVKNVDSALNNGGNVVLTDDLSIDATKTEANSGYGETGVSVKGGTLDGNGNSLGVNSWGTWDCAIHTTGGTIKNLTINSGMRGIFMGSATADVYIDNVVIDGTVYTFNSDGGNKNYGVYISNSTLNGWTSHSDVHKEVVYTNCNFGEGQGYAFCRPYGPTSFVDCDFEAGFELDARGAVTFENCTIGGEPLTAENLSTLVINNIANATVK